MNKLQPLCDRRYYMVNNPNGGPSKTKHYARELAEAEARRLAITHPGEYFTVLEAITAYHLREPTPEVVNLV